MPSSKQEGFTLIELLVVVVIIGILSAIALPTFLNQTAKAKQSEAKSTLGSINTAQTAYRTQNSQFAPNFTTLALGLPTATNNYTYVVIGGGDTATTTATAGDTSLKGYAGGNARTTDSNQQVQILSINCEANQPGTGTPPVPTFGTDPVNPMQCDPKETGY